MNPTITVNAAPTILLGADNQYGLELSGPLWEGVSGLKFVNSSVFSEDYSSIWVLRDYASGTVLASGAAELGISDAVSDVKPAQMSGSTLAIGIVGGVQVLSSATGQPLGTIASPGWSSYPPQNGGGVEQEDWFQLASDGSYIAIVTPQSLSVFSPSAQLLCSKSGAYLGTSLFAAPGQVQVANGPAGANTVETIAVPSCTSTVNAAYQGQFAAWFADGSRFLTQASGTVWTYSNTGSLQATVQIPAPVGALTFEGSDQELGGAGNWIWTFGWNYASQENVLTVYSVGSSTPALTVTSGDIAGYYVSGTTLGIMPRNQTISIVDLSGATPVQTDYAVPPSLNHSYFSELPLVGFAATSGTRWVVGTGQDSGTGMVDTGTGPILDGASLASGTPRYLGRGGVLSMAGSTANVSIATADGQVSTFNPSNATPLSSISLTAQEVALSTDGSVLAAASEDSSLLNVYSLPSGALSDSLSYSGQSTLGTLLNLTLSGSGTTLGIETNTTPPPGDTAQTIPQVVPISGTPAIWTGAATSNLIGSVQLSPDGTLAAVTEGAEPTSVVSIYQNGHLLSAVTGVGVGWIDNGRLLVDNFGYVGTGDYPSYIGCTIYSPTGTVLATPALPQLNTIQTVTSDTVYSQGAIYSLTTGKPTWTNPYDNAFGVVAGSYVVFESQGKVIAVPY